jgi:outer membrane receptor protein involved in Fe transport
MGAMGARAAAAPATGADVVAGSSAAPVVNATTVSGLFTKSTSATGVEVQQRSGVVGDPRVRGLHIGQVVTYGDGGFFFPAREDIDSATSKFSPSAISDVVILKGPYSVRYGPGFSFLDIATLNTPRNPDGFKAGGRTAFSYQANGDRLSPLQSLWGGDANWGYRLTTDFRAGSDYEAGDGRKVPSSYNSLNFNYAVGYSFSDDHKIEIKGLRLYQHDVEFAGYFFDIDRLNTEAYSVRYTLNNQCFWDRLNVDLWYNWTGANGSTSEGAKQAFLTGFLSGPQNFNRPPGAPILDFSTSFFDESSKGYRAVMGWGDKGCWQVNVGTDLNYVTQRLVENIRLLQVGFQDPTLGVTSSTDPFLRQDLGIPRSRLVDPGLFLDASLPINKRLTINAGARADFVYTTSRNRFVSGNFIVTPGTQTNPTVPGQPATPGPAIPPMTGFDPILFSTKPTTNDLSRDFDTWAAFLTADYKIDEHLTGFLKFGYAMRPPDLTELYAAGPFLALLQQGLNRTIGDPNLAAEKLKQTDVGVRADYGFVRAGVTGFYAWIDDYITFDQNKVGGNQLSQVIFTNTDQATLAGGELFAEVDLTENVTPFLTVSYVQGRDLTHVDFRRPPGLVSSRIQFDTEPLPGIPPLEVRSGFRVQEANPRPRWSVEFLSRIVMGQNLIAASLGELPTSGFTIFDVRGFWQVNDILLLSGGVENIGNKFYREHLDRRAGDQLFRPGTNVYLAAELSY